MRGDLKEESSNERWQCNPARLSSLRSNMTFLSCFIPATLLELKEHCHSGDCLGGPENGFSFSRVVARASFGVIDATDLAN